MPSDRYGHPRATALRAMLAATLPAPCIRCGQTIQPTDQWDTDHIIGRVLIPRADWYNPDMVGPAHATCNRRAGQLVAQQRKRSHRWSRDWFGRPTPMEG